MASLENRHVKVSCGGLHTAVVFTNYAGVVQGRQRIHFSSKGGGGRDHSMTFFWKKE